MDRGIVIVEAIGLGKTTDNAIEQNKQQPNPEFEPEPMVITAPPTMPLFNQEGWYRVQTSYTRPTNQKKFRKHNNRKKKRRK